MRGSEIFTKILERNRGLKRVLVHQDAVEAARNIFGDAIHVEPIEG